MTALAGGEIALPAPAGTFLTPAAILLNTWTPTLGPALIGCVLAAAAGYGLGALRPFGRRSEFALLAFAPWLFVGIGPLLPHEMASRVSDAVVFPATPPLFLNIPVLFVATVFFRGHRHRPDPHAIATFLPVLGVLFLVSWTSLAQDTLWWLAVDVEVKSAVGLVVRDAVSPHARPGPTGIGLASPFPVLLLLAAALIALQLTVLDRVKVTTGDPDVSEGGGTVGP